MKWLNIKYYAERNIWNFLYKSLFLCQFYQHAVDVLIQILLYILWFSQMLPSPIAQSECPPSLGVTNKALTIFKNVHHFYTFSKPITWRQWHPLLVVILPVIWHQWHILYSLLFVFLWNQFLRWAIAQLRMVGSQTAQKACTRLACDMSSQKLTSNLTDLACKLNVAL